MPVDIAVIVMETAQTVLPITDIAMAGGIMVTAISMVVSAAATAAHLVDVIEIKFCKIPCDSKQVKTYSIPIPSPCTVDAIQIFGSKQLTLALHETGKCIHVVTGLLVELLENSVQ